jgi:hypothetical protein
MLQAVRLMGHDHRAETVALVRQRAAEPAERGRRGIGLAVGAVVAHEGPAGEVGAGRPRDLDAFAGVGAVTVVLDLVDEDAGCQALRPSLVDREPAGLRHLASCRVA